MPVRVYIVEDHPLMRETLADFIHLTPDLALCGTADAAAPALAELDTACPDVVLVDLALPDRSGLQLVREIREQGSTPCLILSGHGERSYVARALAAGASGYILKGKPADIPRAIRQVVSEGEIYLSPPLGRAADYRDANGA